MQWRQPVVPRHHSCLPVSSRSPGVCMLPDRCRMSDVPHVEAACWPGGEVWRLQRGVVLVVDTPGRRALLGQLAHNFWPPGWLWRDSPSPSAPGWPTASVWRSVSPAGDSAGEQYHQGWWWQGVPASVCGIPGTGPLVTTRAPASVPPSVAPSVEMLRVVFCRQSTYVSVSAAQVIGFQQNMQRDFCDCWCQRELERKLTNSMEQAALEVEQFHSYAWYHDSVAV